MSGQFEAKALSFVHRLTRFSGEVLKSQTPNTRKMAADQGKVDFSGKYKHVSSDKFEEFLEKNGAPWIARKIAVNSNPDVEIIQDGDNFTLRVLSIIFSKESKFTIGQEFEEKQQNGPVMKVLPEWDGAKLVLNYSPKEEDSTVKKQKTTRDLKDSQLILTMELEDVTCTRVYERVIVE